MNWKRICQDVCDSTFFSNDCFLKGKRKKNAVYLKLIQWKDSFSLVNILAHVYVFPGGVEAKESSSCSVFACLSSIVFSIWTAKALHNIYKLLKAVKNVEWSDKREKNDIFGGKIWIVRRLQNGLQQTKLKNGGNISSTTSSRRCVFFFSMHIFGWLSWVLELNGKISPFLSCNQF